MSPSEEVKAEEKRRRIVNDSGFPLQLGLERLVGKLTNPYWYVLATEHPWHNVNGDSCGFIDLILANRYNTEYMILECKRVRDSQWIFLAPEGRPKRNDVKPWLRYRNSNTLKYFDWAETSVEPASIFAEFCVVPGQDKSKPILERTAAEVVDATEALAIEDLEIDQKYNASTGSSIDGLRLYYTVIVTTAELVVCHYDPDNIDISVGELSEGTFETVPYLRFKKTLSPRKNDSHNPQNLPQMHREKQRVVFVVNSSSFADFLDEWHLDNQALAEKLNFWNMSR